MENVNINATGGNIAGICGNNAGGISHCVIKSGSIASSGGNVGGIAGNTEHNSTIEYCSNAAAVSGGFGTAGIVGSASFSPNSCHINDCINYGAITGKSSGDAAGIVGYATGQGWIYACCNFGTILSGGSLGSAFIGFTGNVNAGNDSYYDPSTCSGTGGSATNPYPPAVAMTATEMQSGKLAWILNGKTSQKEPQVYGQKIGTDAFPVITADSAKHVYAAGTVKCNGDPVGTVTYTNNSSAKLTVQEHIWGEWENTSNNTMHTRVCMVDFSHVESGSHTLVWDTTTHRHYCSVCNWTEQTDSLDPSISNVTNGGVYYGDTTISVSDANLSDTKIDGKSITPCWGDKVISADNASHTVTAYDASGRSTTVTFTVYKQYAVTLPQDPTTYTIASDSAVPVNYGGNYHFTVTPAKGYYKSPSFLVTANGTPLTPAADGSFTITDIQSEPVITVAGIEEVPISVSIEWGEMSFTFTGESNGTWNPDTYTYEGISTGSWQPSSEGGNKISVQNDSTDAITASFAYTASNAAVSGSFAADALGQTAITAPVSIDASGKSSAYLILTGKPTESISATVLGNVTVTIGVN